MKLSRLHKMMAGVLIILTGIGLLLDGFGIISFSLFDLWPLVLVYIGVRLWNDKKRIRGGILLFFGIGIFLEMWFSFGLHDVIELAIPLLLIYFGYRLIRGWNREPDDPPFREAEPAAQQQEPEPPMHHTAPDLNRGRRKGWSRYRPHAARMQKEEALPGGILLPRDSRSSLIGDFHLTSGRFELHHLQIWHGIGDVVIDLSRAVLTQEEEAVLSVEGWIGDVTIYVPVDLPVSVFAEVSVGDLEVFGHRQGGISRSIIIRSERFDQAVQKVHLHISLLVGDVKVKYI